MPNDEPEIQRLNEQHWVLTQVKGGKLHFAPLPKDTNGLRILDIGCGSGIWCVEMAEEYPKAMIVGMDVSPIQPKTKPANVEWIVQDMEDTWRFPEDYFDLIHLSLVHGCVADWDQMMQQITTHLRPGGWVEHQEFSLCRQYLMDEDYQPLPMSDNLDELQPFFKWNRLMEQAALKRGRLLQLGPRLSEFQRNAGLINGAEDVIAHKWGTWMSDPTERALGARTMLGAISGMEGFTTAMFTKALGWSVADTQVFIQEVKRDMRDDNLRKVMDLHVVRSQKPLDKAREGPSASRKGSLQSKIGFSLSQVGAGILIGAAAASALSTWLARRR